MAKPKVFVTRPIPQKGITLLQKSCEVRVHPHPHKISPAELKKGVLWCDALLSLLTDKITSEILDLNPRLKIVANYAVGFDNIDVKYATSKGIVVTNTPGTLEDAVAEHTIALMMGICRRLVEADKFMRTGKYKVWQPMLLVGSQLRGKTLGIVGGGRIGCDVARKAARGFEMKVVYSDIKRNFEFEKEVGARLVTLPDLLKQSDFVSLHVPLLPSTRHLIGAKELRLMKKTAFLINTARGPVIDEKALVAALKKKVIAGAALDVFEFEPKMVSGLAGFSNVLVTPHIASATIEAREAMGEIAAKNILAVLAGKKAITPVKL